jgi:hypothetical protein
MNSGSEPTPMVCGICLEPLNRYWSVDDSGDITGESHFVHRARDHEPAPHP